MVSVQTVKELRQKTGAGMMDCKNALKENNNDMEAAIDWLRTRGLAKAAKKAGRTAAEGLIGVAVEGNRGAIVEINAETDFVARNEQFQNMVTLVVQTALDTSSDTETLLGKTISQENTIVSDYVAGTAGSIGENISLRRSTSLAVKEGVVCSYIHNAVGDNLGRIGVLVALESSGDKEQISQIGRQIAMHIAAASPLALTIEDIDPSLVQRERAILLAEAQESGKPEGVIEKMVEGRMRKFYQEVVLLSQTFVIDNERTIEIFVKDAAKDCRAPITLTGFARYALGEGLDIEPGKDFSTEVAEAVSGSR
ncbi:MAG: translation elongation factor Ts [Parvularculales bacterium]